jgi:transcription-repair coupling factor (superfamily II helicase)
VCAYVHTYIHSYIHIAEAQQRLDALQEFGVLGSGYALAQRDLEIRGAGSLLGADQSGEANDVGVKLYMQVRECALRVRARERASEREREIDRDGHRHRQRQTERERQTERQRESARERQREKERDREREISSSTCR